MTGPGQPQTCSHSINARTLIVINICSVYAQYSTISASDEYYEKPPVEI